MKVPATGDLILRCNMLISYVYVSSSTHIYAATLECTMYSISTEVLRKLQMEKERKRKLTETGMIAIQKYRLDPVSSTRKK